MSLLVDRGRWLADLKPGDRVIVTTTPSDMRIGVVEKVQKVHVLVRIGWSKEPEKFNLRTGRRAGKRDAWHFCTIQPFLPDSLEKILVNRARDYLARLPQMTDAQAVLIAKFARETIEKSHE